MLKGYNPATIEELEGAGQAITALLNLVETMKQENQGLRAEVQCLRDEFNRLKGEQGKAEIKAGKAQAHSSEKERRQPKGWHKGRKNERIIINREQKLTVEKGELPVDAEFNTHRA